MKWRWAKDSFLCENLGWLGFVRREPCLDKVHHFWAGLILELVGLLIFGFLQWLPVTIVLAVSFLLWECKDAVVPWEEYGRWGGDGFSWKDLACSYVGILIGLLVCS